MCINLRYLYLLTITCRQATVMIQNFKKVDKTNSCVFLNFLVGHLDWILCFRMHTMWPGCAQNAQDTHWSFLLIHCQDHLMTLGLVNSPTAFQTIINEILPECLDQEGCWIYWWHLNLHQHSCGIHYSCLSAKKLDFASTPLWTHSVVEFASGQHPVHPMNPVLNFRSQSGLVNVVH